MASISLLSISSFLFISRVFAPSFLRPLIAAFKSVLDVSSAFVILESASAIFSHKIFPESLYTQQFGIISWTFSVSWDSGSCLNPIFVVAGGWSVWVQAARSDSPSVGWGFSISFIFKACAIWLCPADATKWPVWDMGCGPPHSLVFKCIECYLGLGLCMCGSEVHGVHERLYGVTLLSFSLSMGFLVPSSLLGSPLSPSRQPWIDLPSSATCFPQLHLWGALSGRRTVRGKKKQGFAPPSQGHSSSVQRRRLLSLRILGALQARVQKNGENKKGGFVFTLSKYEETPFFFLKPELERFSWGSFCPCWWCSLLGLDCLMSKQEDVGGKKRPVW